ncbi:hypothetical protein V6Z11_A08G237900 [Gossypium hirsutum]
MGLLGLFRFGLMMGIGLGLMYLGCFVPKTWTVGDMVHVFFILLYCNFKEIRIVILILFHCNIKETRS